MSRIDRVWDVIGGWIPALLGVAVLLALALLMTGCASPYVQRASDGYDESLEAAELWICRGASVGSVQRRYGQSEELTWAWRRLCAEQPATVIGGSE